MILSKYFIAHPLVLTLLIAHVLSDFHWQSQEIADQKQLRWNILAKHLVVVALPLIGLSLVVPHLAVVSGAVLMSHVVIDSIKRLLPKRYFLMIQQQQLSFVLDQLAHIIAIFSTYHCFLRNGVEADIISQYDIDWNQLGYLLRLLLFILLITKPMNVMFKLFFSKYQVKELSQLLREEVVQTRDKKEQREETVAGAGALIGNLERIIIGLFLILGQYAAIGLVFTAKSIARYDRISKSQAFAEYYPIGSLFSMISVAITYLVLF